MSEVLARRDRALTPEETEALLRDRLGEGLVGSTVEFATFTVHIAPGHWHAAAQLCRDESLLAYDMFDSLFGVDARDEGFDVVAVLYSTSTGNRICLRTRCEGGREAPVCDTVTDVFRGADWMERETWDMFGIDFAGHPGLEPRLLTVENFEGWPLRKDFHLSSRVAKPWPGVKEPAELDEDGNIIERVPQIGDAPGPYDLDKAMAEQARSVNAVEEIEEASDTGATAEASASDAGDEAQAEDEPQVDQETYDRLIAEGKSERIARSKAKAALIKKQRAAAAEADEAGPEAAGDDARSNDDGPAQAAGDPAAEAAAKADERRKAQAEARAKKAADRADQDADDGGVAAGEADEGGDHQADGGDGSSQEDQA